MQLEYWLHIAQGEAFETIRHKKWLCSCLRTGLYLLYKYHEYHIFKIICGLPKHLSEYWKLMKKNNMSLSYVIDFEKSTELKFKIKVELHGWNVSPSLPSGWALGEFQPLTKFVRGVVSRAGAPCTQLSSSYQVLDAYIRKLRKHQMKVIEGF